MTKNTKISAGIFAAAFLAWFYFTPHQALMGMRSAIEQKNAVKLAEYVNFPSLKESLKSTLNSALAAEMAKKQRNNPFAALGAAIAGVMVGPMVDAMVSPEGLAQLMKGDSSGNQKNASAASNAGAADKTSNPGTEISTKYESFSTFVVSVKKTNQDKEPVRLIFLRDGWFGWKLSGAQLPL